jgi:hypothetical protein
MRKYIKLGILIVALSFFGQWGYTGTVSPPAPIWADFPAVSDVNMDNSKIENLAGPTNPNDAVNLSYFNSNEQYLPYDPASSSVDMNGYSIDSLADPSTDSEAVTLSYFQANDSFEADNYLPDDPASSGVNMNGYQIGSLADPNSDSDAVTLGYFNANDGVTGKDSGSSLGDGTTINWGSNLSATLSSGEFTVDASSGGSGDTTVNVFDSGTFQGEASDLDFSTDLSVSFSGDTATVSSTASSNSTSDSDYFMISMAVTKLPPNTSQDKIIKSSSNEKWIIDSGGISDTSFSTPNNTSLKIINGYGEVSDTVASPRNENISISLDSEFVLMRMKNNSSDTNYLSSFIQVKK